MHCQSQNEFDVGANNMNNMNDMTFSNFGLKSIIFLIDMEFEFLWWTFKKDAMCKKSCKLIFKSFLELSLYWMTESPDYFW